MITERQVATQSSFSPNVKKNKKRYSGVAKRDAGKERYYIVSSSFQKNTPVYSFVSVVGYDNDVRESEKIKAYIAPLYIIVTNSNASQ